MHTKITKSRWSRILLYGSVLIAAGCTKMDHYYKDLIVLGDRNYIGKADSVWVYPGNGRLKVAWTTPVDPAAGHMIVYWNDYNDSAVAAIDHNADTGYLLIEGLAEGSYTLNVVARDNVGNYSLPVEKTTEVFGNKFQETLRNRAIDHVVILKDSAVVLWNEEEASETMIGTEIDYVDKAGKLQKTRTSQSFAQTSLYNVDTTKEISFRSFFIPDSMALDTFTAAYEKARLNDLQLHRLTLKGVGTSTADYIDFSMVTVHDYNYAESYPERIDVVHMRGSSSHQNLIAITNDAGFAAFSSSLRDDIISWSIRNDCKMVNLGDGSSARAAYEGLNETDRTAMKAAFDNAADDHSPSGRLTKIGPGDILMLHSVDRDIYVAVKTISSSDDGDLTIEFKVSRF